MLCVSVVTMYCFCLSMASEKLIRNKYVDPLAERAMLKKFVFTNATKHWDNYVRKLMEYSTKRVVSENVLRKEPSINCLPKHKSITIYLQDSVKILKHFVMKSKQVNALNVSSKMSYDSEIHETILFKPLMTYRPSDIDIMSNSYIEDNIMSNGYIEDIQIKQYFVLNPNLQLNLSVHYMYFSFNSFLKCFFGSLNIESITHVNGKNPQNTKYKYCGIVSSFILYPASNKVTITISVESYKVTFDSIISYSVMDSHKIISYEGKRTISVAPITVMKLLSTDQYLLKYQLEVERYERINIICNISQYDVISIFDGPGTSCNILEPFEGNGKMAHYTSTM